MQTETAVHIFKHEIFYICRYMRDSCTENNTQLRAFTKEVTSCGFHNLVSKQNVQTDNIILALFQTIYETYII